MCGGGGGGGGAAFLTFRLLCFPIRHAPSEKESTLKGKDLLPNSFLFREDPFSKGRENF